MTLLGGLDIGGTKCAVLIGRETADGIEVIAKHSFPTPASPHESLETMSTEFERLLAENNSGEDELGAIGISCGGPLNSKEGLVLSPPNLPNWDRIDVITPIHSRFGVPVGLQNDANACALAEWKWGAGRGTKNMIFLTFGTGMGAGLILNGQLYSGTNDMAGEVGHMRIAPDGPIGFGKNGSFEGFCSGGGIARMSQTMALRWLQDGRSTKLCATMNQIDSITAKLVGEAATEGDELALAVMARIGQQLGAGLSILVDILNPEVIVIGSIFARQQALLEPQMYQQLEQEALSIPLSVCRVVPAGLGEGVGDAASLSIAQHTMVQAQQ